MAALQAAVSADVSDFGFKQAMQQRWVALDKSSGDPRVVRKVGTSSQPSLSPSLPPQPATCCNRLRGSSRAEQWHTGRNSICTLLLLLQCCWKTHCTVSIALAVSEAAMFVLVHVLVQVEMVEDVTQQQLADIAAGKEPSKAIADSLKKRKLLKLE
jgi:hypothetical protein